MENRKYWMIAITMLLGISCFASSQAQDAGASANTNVCKDLNPPQDPDGDGFLAMSGQDNYEKDQADKYGSAYTSPVQSRADQICAYFGCQAGASFNDYACSQTPRGNYSLATVDAQGNISVDSYSPFTPRGISWGAPPIYTVCSFTRIICKAQTTQSGVQAPTVQQMTPFAKSFGNGSSGGPGWDNNSGGAEVSEGNGYYYNTGTGQVEYDPYGD